MPSPRTKKLSGVFHFVAGAMILFWVLESCINSHKPSWHYVDANASPDGIQGWLPGAEHIARAMTIHVHADTTQDPSPIHATFTPAVGRAHARIRILTLEAATSRC